MYALPCFSEKPFEDSHDMSSIQYARQTSRGKSRVQEQLSTPKFGALYHFTKVSSDDFKAMT